MPCPQCGQSVTIGAPVCPTCGLRFNPQQMERGRPNGNAAQPGRAPAFDDGMPGWLRQIQGQTPPPPPPSQYQSPSQYQPQPPYQSPSQYQPPAPQIPGNSLMSGDALPAWLREVGGNPPAPNQYGAPPAPNQYGQPAAPNYPSQMPQQQPYQQQQQWPQQMAPDPRQPRIPSPGAAVASNALFDEASLPEWLRQSAGQGGDQPTIQQGYPPQGRMPYNSASPYAPPAANGYPAQPSPQSAFPSLDQAVAAPRSLPSPGMSPAPQGDAGGWFGGGMQPPDNGQRGAQSGMAAQSLIDETALPTWLRSQPQPLQGRQSQLGQPANPPSVAWDAPQIPAAPQWNQPAGYASPSQAPQQVGGGSFVDDGALPGWLRGQGGQPAPDQGYGAMNPPQQNGGYRPAGGAPSILPQYGPGAAAEPAPGQFSASDLIDPQALPGWVQRSDDPQASFSSSGGWSAAQPTSRQPRADAVDPAARGATGRQPAYDPYGQPDAAPRERGRQTGTYPATNSQIPQEELPPWLQGTPSSGVPGGSARSGGYDDDRRPARGNGRVDDGYAEDWDDPNYADPNYAESQYEEPYTDELAARQQGYGPQYDDGYGYDPRADPRAEPGYTGEYDAPPPRGRDRRYGGAPDEGYVDPNYDRVGMAWKPPEDDKHGGNAKRGGWRKLFGRR